MGYYGKLLFTLPSKNRDRRVIEYKKNLYCLILLKAISDKCKQLFLDWNFEHYCYQ